MTKKHTHGGKRKGAGRKPGLAKLGDSTSRITIPLEYKPIVKELIEHIAAVRIKKQSDVDVLGPAIVRISATRPLFAEAVQAGFPSPADDYVDLQLDLNEYVDAGNPAVFYCRVAGNSMSGAGIFNGDIIVVNKSLEPRHDDVVVAVVNNELTVKRLYKRGNTIALHPENPLYPIIEFKTGMELKVWGVVTNVTRKLRSS